MRRDLSLLFLKTLCTVLLMGIVPIYAQNFSISGRIIESSSGRPIEMAVAQILRLDSTFINGVSSDSTGLFQLKVSNEGEYIIKVSYVGFQPTFRNLRLTKEQPQIQIDSIALMGSDILLRGASIIGKAAPMEIIEDTLVYNAAAYKVPEGEALEELIKLLPGVEIDDDGKITVNGREVKEFRINGKDFFKGNTKIALKNLPVELVDKIKSYEKKSDYAEQTGIDDGNEQTVMDIQLKKELNETWISNLDLAYGSADRYQAKLFANRMTDNSRISIIGGTENTNARNINRNIGTDLNFTNNKKRNEAGRYEIGGHINLNSNAGHSSSWRNSEQFNSGESSTFSNNSNYNKNRNNGVNGNLKLMWKPDTLSTITISPNFSYNKNFSFSRSNSASFNADPYKYTDDPLNSIFQPNLSPELQSIAVNRNGNRSMNNGNNHSFSANLMYVRRLNAKGRNISFDVSASQSKSEGANYRISDIWYYKTGKNTFQNQYTNSPSKNWNYSLRTSYSEPILKNLFFQASYNFSQSYANNNRSLYELDSLVGWNTDIHELGTLPIGKDSLELAYNRENSQYTTQWNTTQREDLSIRLTTSKINMQIGTNLRQQHTRMLYKKNEIDTTLTRDVIRFSPSVRFRYKFSRDSQLEFQYNGASSDPSLTNRIADTDNSNPLNIHTGNAHLQPSWKNNFKLKWNKYIVDRQQNWVLEANAEQSNNDISTAVNYDEATGVRHTRPENINGNWNIGTNFMFNTAIDKNRKFNLSTNTRFNYEHTVGFLRTSNTQSSSKNVTQNTSINERLSGRYRNNWFELNLNGSLRYTHSVNKLRPTSNLDTWNYSYAARTRLSLPWKMYVSTELNISSRRGYQNANMNTDEWIWNVEISQNFFRGNPLILKINMYDILRQRSNVRHTVNANSRSDSESDASYSYFMAHVIFRVNIFNGKIAFGHRGRKNNRSSNNTRNIKNERNTPSRF